MKPANDLTIFNAALEIYDPEERTRYLENACAGNRELRAKVEKLLGEVARGVETFSRFVPVRTAPSRARNFIGESIGPYRIIEQLGTGGCGVVYLAEQESPIRRRVALKIIRAGMDSERVIVRFEAERHAMALMDHPNIAKVFDAGVTDSGRPFFVMELVIGEKISDYCQSRRLGIDKRLELFVQICHAVQHAHQKGVIHRDLKPSNILVTEVDEAAAPKIIDFGIAKAISGRLGNQSVVTMAEMFVGTPAYMSPEQALMTGDNIDTRTDIYALGVLLYELLTGKPPFDNQELLTAGLDEMRRIIREVEPKRPGESMPKGRGARNGLSERIDADVDWIVMKCLEKDRARRYATANALAEDITRYCGNEPVAARPPSRVYRFEKFVRRNKLQFAAGTVTALALFVAAFISIWHAIKSSRAEEAQAQARALAESRLDAAVDYADGIAGVGFEIRNLIGAAKISEELTTNTLRLVAQLRADQEDSARFRYVLGRLHLQVALNLAWPRANSAWDPELGLSAATNAIQLLKSADDGRTNDARIYQLALAEQNAAIAALFLKRFDEAFSHWSEMARWARQLMSSASYREHGVRMDRAARFAHGTALLRMDRAEEALTNYFQPWAAEARAYGASNAQYVLATGPLAMSHKFLALASSQLGRHEEALAYCKESLPHFEEIYRRSPNGAESADNVTIMTAQLGAAHLAVFQPEGLNRLNEAMASTKSLRGRDPARFLMTDFEVQKYCAFGYADWALDPSATREQRDERIARAEAHLARVQELRNQFGARSAREALDYDVQDIKRRLAKAVGTDRRQDLWPGNG